MNELCCKGVNGLRCQILVVEKHFVVKGAHATVASNLDSCKIRWQS